MSTSSTWAGATFQEFTDPHSKGVSTVIFSSEKFAMPGSNASTRGRRPTPITDRSVLNLPVLKVRKPQHQSPRGFDIPHRGN